MWLQDEQEEIKEIFLLGERKMNPEQRKLKKGIKARKRRKKYLKRKRLAKHGIHLKEPKSREFKIEAKAVIKKPKLKIKVEKKKKLNFIQKSWQSIKKSLKLN